MGELRTMPGHNADAERLIEWARRGDRAARERLLTLHRARLRKMIAVRMDPRLAARVDPSDVVQDTLMEAARRLSEFLSQQVIPFYPWLRNLAAERLVQLQRLHIRSQRRSVNREEKGALLSDASAAKLANCILPGTHNPLSRLQKAELLAQVRTALDELPERDREILVLRYLEQLSIADTAAVLQVSGAVVKMRHLRALERLRDLLEEDHRTDIYSLGVTLYELLTLQPAFPETDRRELLRQIADEDPRRPRSLNKSIPIELETIVGKAISKNASGRYSTAQELSDDLRRFLEHKTISARPPGFGERIGRWTRRHRLLARSLAAISADGAVRISNTTTWEIERRLPLTGIIFALGYSADGSRLGSARRPFKFVKFGVTFRPGWQIQCWEAARKRNCVSGSAPPVGTTRVADGNCPSR